MKINVSSIRTTKNEVQLLLRTPKEISIRLSLEGVLGLIEHLECDIEKLNKKLKNLSCLNGWNQTMKYGPEYQGLETSDEIIQSLEEKYEGRVCEEGSEAYQEWYDPENLNDILKRAWEIAKPEIDKLFWGMKSFLR